MRLLCAAALALSFGLWVAFAEDRPSDPKAARAARLAELKKRYDETCKELAERHTKADADGRRGIEAEMREEMILIAGKLIKVAEDDPKDDVAFEACALIIREAGKVSAEGPDVEKAAGFVADHHTNNAKVKDLLLPATRAGASGAKLLKTASEKSTDKATKGTALYLRGSQIARGIEDVEDEKKVPGLIQTATELLETAAQTAPDTRTGDTTIAMAVEARLVDLKAIGALLVGRPAPDVASKLLDDKKVNLSDYKGKVVLFDVWATWCPPCRAMIPHERTLVKRMKDKPFVLVSVSADKEKKALTDFLKKEEMPWVHWWDDGQKSAVLSTYRISGFPTLYLIDHEGIIRHRWLFGPPDDSELDAAVEALVKVAEKK